LRVDVARRATARRFSFGRFRSKCHVVDPRKP
jgi:hypothetical protein